MTNTIEVLLIEDDKQFCLTLQAFLQANQFNVKIALNASEALECIKRAKFDIILLDLTLPDEDGLALLRKLRHTCALPVIIISGRSDEEDRISGLELGADDYIVKPFSPKELALRIRKRLSYEQKSQNLNRLQVGKFWLDIDTKSLIEDSGTYISVTPNEFHILQTLAAHPGHVFSRSQLIDACLKIDGPQSPRAIDITVSRLRAKLEVDPRKPNLLLTVKGFGYKLEPFS